MKTLAAFVFGLAVLLTVQMSWGTLYTVSENYGGVSALNQNNVEEVGGGTGANSCVPTATMTSFQYLNVFYDNVYGTNPATGNPTLMGPSATWTDAATNLSQNYMFTDPVTATSANNWIDGKVNYLNTFAPGKTFFEGQTTLYTGAQPWVQNANPTANFLLQILQQGEDIEIGILPPAGTVPFIGHALTLTSIEWNDADNSNTFNAGDALSIDGFDPAGGVFFDFPLNPAGANGLITFGGANDPYLNYNLVLAVAESPIAEPSTILLLGAGLTGVGLLRKRFKN